VEFHAWFHHEAATRVVNKEVAEHEVNLTNAKIGFHRLDRAVVRASKNGESPRLSMIQAHEAGRDLRALLLWILSARSQVGVNYIFGGCFDKLDMVATHDDNRDGDDPSVAAVIRRKALALLLEAHSADPLDGGSHKAVLTVARALDRYAHWTQPSHQEARLQALEVRQTKVEQEMRHFLEAQRRSEEELAQVQRQAAEDQRCAAAVQRRLEGELAQAIRKIDQYAFRLEGLESEAKRARGGVRCDRREPEQGDRYDRREPEQEGSPSAGQQDGRP